MQSIKHTVAGFMPGTTSSNTQGTSNTETDATHENFHSTQTYDSTDSKYLADSATHRRPNGIAGSRDSNSHTGGGTDLDALAPLSEPRMVGRGQSAPFDSGTSTRDGVDVLGPSMAGIDTQSSSRAGGGTNLDALAPLSEPRIVDRGPSAPFASGTSTRDGADVPRPFMAGIGTQSTSRGGGGTNLDALAPLSEPSTSSTARSARLTSGTNIRDEIDPPEPSIANISTEESIRGPSTAPTSNIGSMDSMAAQTDPLNNGADTLGTLAPKPEQLIRGTGTTDAPQERQVTPSVGTSMGATDERPTAGNRQDTAQLMRNLPGRFPTPLPSYTGTSPSIEQQHGTSESNNPYSSTHNSYKHDSTPLTQTSGERALPRIPAMGADSAFEEGFPQEQSAKDAPGPNVPIGPGSSEDGGAGIGKTNDLLEEAGGATQPTSVATGESDLTADGTPQDGHKPTLGEKVKHMLHLDK